MPPSSLDDNKVDRLQRRVDYLTRQLQQLDVDPGRTGTSAGGTAVYEHVGAVPFSVVGDQPFIIHPVRNDYKLKSAKVYAKTGATNDYDIYVKVDGQTEHTIGLTGGNSNTDQTTTETVGVEVDEGQILFVVGQSSADASLANVAVAFDTDYRG